MIYIILKAQLGNQLFQIFNIINLSLEYNIDYNICCDNNETTIYENKKTYFHNFLSKLKNKVNKIEKKDLENNIINNILYKENKFEYNKIILNNLDINKDIYIDGFFQSYKYFDKHYNTIIELLEIKKNQEILKKKYNYIYNKKTIGIHFRIGDYLQIQELHPIQTIKYYYNALNYLIENLNKNNDNILNYNIIFFCQECDNDFILKYINRLNDIYINKLNFIKINDSICEWEQMLMISLCDNIIIANSTFSWFGGYFSNSNVIIYPSKWFGKYYKNNTINDLIPNNWILINDY